MYVPFYSVCCCCYSRYSHATMAAMWGTLGAHKQLRVRIKAWGRCGWSNTRYGDDHMGVPNWPWLRGRFHDKYMPILRWAKTNRVHLTNRKILKFLCNYPVFLLQSGFGTAYSEAVSQSNDRMLKSCQLQRDLTWFYESNTNPRKWFARTVGHCCGCGDVQAEGVSNGALRLQRRQFSIPEKQSMAA